VATVSGGAIFILGASQYQVLDSFFHGNAVAPATWARTTSYGLMITTAGSGASEDSSQMWSIDHGPVFGLPTADCDAARQASAQGIGRGLAPSWPGDAPCSNDTVYQSSELYAHGLKLGEGTHALHVGTFARPAGNAVTWPGGGKIEVVGLLKPTFPSFVDDRQTLRYPGCQVGKLVYSACPGGEAFWIDIPLHVSVGKVRRTSPLIGEGGTL
jgi:hypothetical protein